MIDKKYQEKILELIKDKKTINSPFFPASDASHIESIIKSSLSEVCSMNNFKYFPVGFAGVNFFYTIGKPALDNQISTPHSASPQKLFGNAGI